MYSIGQILPSLFNDFGIEDAVKLKFLRKKWSEIFTAPLSEHSFPKEIKNSVLYVTVNCHTWLNELKMLKEEFLEKLKPFGITDVEFKFGRIPSRKHASSTKKLCKTLSSEQKDWVNSIVKNVKDEEIKSLAESIITKYLLNINAKQ